MKKKAATVFPVDNELWEIQAEMQELAELLGDQQIARLDLLEEVLGRLTEVEGQLVEAYKDARARPRLVEDLGRVYTSTYLESKPGPRH